MDGPIQNVLPNILNGWPHTECLHGWPIQNVNHNMLNGWPHTECFHKHAKWMAPYRMFFYTY